MKHNLLFLSIFLSLSFSNSISAQCEIPEEQTNLIIRLYRNTEDLVREMKLPKEIIQDRKDAALIKDWKLRSDYWQRKSEGYLYGKLKKDKEVNAVTEVLTEEREDRVKETRSLYQDMVEYAGKGADMIYNQMLFIAGFALIGLIGFGLYIYLKKSVKPL